MEDNNFFEEKRKTHWVAILLVVLLVVAGVSWSSYNYFKKSNVADIANTTVANKLNIVSQDTNTIINENSNLLPDSGTKKNDQPADGAFLSQNYKISDISVGGSGIYLGGDEKNAPLRIADTKGEVLRTKDGKSSRLLVSWRTSKLAKSTVAYQKDGAAPKNVAEKNPGYLHAMLLDVDDASRYTYAITANDQWGSKIASDKISVLIGGQKMSVFELIASQFRDMFKWVF